MARKASKPVAKGKAGPSKAEIGGNSPVPKGRSTTQVPLPVVTKMVEQATQKGYALGMRAAKGGQGRVVAPAARPRRPELPSSAIPLTPGRNPFLAQALGEGRAQQQGGLDMVRRILQGMQAAPAASPSRRPGMVNPLDVLKAAGARAQGRQAPTPPVNPLEALAALRRLRER